MWMRLQLASTLPKPTFTPRHWPSISEAEVTSPTLGKASQTGLQGQTPRGNAFFHSVFQGAPSHFLMS